MCMKGEPNRLHQTHMSNNKKSPKPRSAAQLAASRANGTKSLGPKSPNGKAKVSSSRISHGFRANNIPLANENRDAYAEHLDAYLARYTPIDKVELDLVGLLATNMWQLMRINSMEVALFDLEMCGVEPEVHRDYKTMDEYGRLALAFKKSTGDKALELIRRYKSTADRAYHRALQALEQIQKDRTPPSAALAPVEPTRNNPAIQTREPAQLASVKQDPPPDGPQPNPAILQVAAPVAPLPLPWKDAA